MPVVKSLPEEFHGLPYDQQLMLMLVPKEILNNVSNKLKNDPNYSMEDAYAEYGQQIDAALAPYKPQGTNDDGGGGGSPALGALATIATTVAAKKAGAYVAGQIGSAVGGGSTAAVAAPNVVSAQAIGSGASAAGGSAAGTTAATTGASTAGASTAGGSAVGGGAAGGAGGGATATGGSATFGGMGAAGAAGIAAGLYAGYRGYQNYRGLRKQGIDIGDMTKEEADSIYYPDLFGEQKFTKDLGLPDIAKYSVIGQLGRALFASTKNKDQIMRDRVRDVLEKEGILSKNEKGSHEITLADGTKFDVGRDGGSSFKGKDGKDVKYGYEADWSNPLTGLAAGLVNPLVRLYSSSGEDSAFKNQLINAAVSNAENEQDVVANIRHFYDLFGADRAGAYSRLNEVANMKDSNLSGDELAAYQNAVNMAFNDDGSGSYDWSTFKSGLGTEQNTNQPGTPNNEVGNMSNARQNNQPFMSSQMSPEQMQMLQQQLGSPDYSNFSMPQMQGVTPNMSGAEFLKSDTGQQFQAMPRGGMQQPQAQAQAPAPDLNRQRLEAGSQYFAPLQEQVARFQGDMPVGARVGPNFYDQLGQELRARYGGPDRREEPTRSITLAEALYGRR